MPWPFGKRTSCQAFGESLGDLVIELATSATTESMRLPVLANRDRERVFGGYLGLGDYVLGTVVESMRVPENYKTAIDRGETSRIYPILQNIFHLTDLEIATKLSASDASVKIIVARAQGKTNYRDIWAEYTTRLMFDDPVSDATLVTLIDKYFMDVYQGARRLAGKTRLANPGSLLEVYGLIGPESPK